MRGNDVGDEVNKTFSSYRALYILEPREILKTYNDDSRIQSIRQFTSIYRK